MEVVFQFKLEVNVEVFVAVLELMGVILSATIVVLLLQMIAWEKKTKIGDLKVAEIYLECSCEHPEEFHTESPSKLTICCYPGCRCNFERIPFEKIVDADPRR